MKGTKELFVDLIVITIMVVGSVWLLTIEMPFP